MTLLEERYVRMHLTNTNTLFSQGGLTIVFTWERPPQIPPRSPSTVGHEKDGGRTRLTSPSANQCGIGGTTGQGYQS